MRADGGDGSIAATPGNGSCDIFLWAIVISADGGELLCQAGQDGGVIRGYRY